MNKQNTILSNIKSNFKINTFSLSLPKHVAIIMDGNGRWAKKRGKLRIFGHQAGMKSIKRAINFSIIHNFTALTLYAFSNENWNRPYKEVYHLMSLFISFIKKEEKNLYKKNIKLRIIGDKSIFGTKLQNYINYIEKLTSNNNRLNLNIAINYSGRWDIIQAVKQIAIKIEKGILNSNKINEHILCKMICMNELDPVDLMIRTGGEYRLSNFLLWQIAYTELFFTNVLWPDFNDLIFLDACNSFAKRERKFGSIYKDFNYI